MRPWLIGGLIVSAALNLFLIGAAAGILTMGAHLAHQRPPGRPGPGGGQLWRASRVLPPAEAQAFRQALRAQAQAVRPLAEAGPRAREQAWLSGAAERFDAAATKAALARARSADMQTRQRLEEAVVDIAGALPPDQRRAVFQALATPPRFRQGRPPPGMGPGPAALPLPAEGPEPGPPPGNAAP
jgi:uncharacterized membrane protein